MSLILDALKRAQGERQSTETRVAEELLGSPAAAPQKSSSLVLWIISFLLMAILVSLWFLFKQDTSSETNPVVSELIKSEPIKTVSVSSTQSSRSSAVAAVTPAAVSDLYQQSASSTPGVQDVQIAQLYTEKSAAPSITNETVSVDNPLPDMNQSLPQSMQVTTEVRRLADLTGVIAFEDLSLNQKKLFPSINYSQHNYLGNSASSVVINGDLMRVGSRIASGIEIVDVLEDGIVLRIEGREVSFKALNSWINM